MIKDILEFWIKYISIKIFYWPKDNVLTANILRSIKLSRLEFKFNRSYSCKNDDVNLNFVKNKNWGKKK